MDAEQKLKQIYRLLNIQKEELKRLIQDCQAKIVVINDILTELEDSRVINADKENEDEIQC